MFKKTVFTLATAAAVSLPAFGARYAPLPVDSETSKLAPDSKFISANKLMTSGKLPNAAQFAADNNLVSNEVLCIRVDMFRTGTNSSNSRAVYWWECELKVLSKTGVLLYHVSTVWRDRSYHEGLGIEDDKCRIFYYPSGPNPTTGICAKPKKELKRSAGGSGISIFKYEGFTTGQFYGGYTSKPVSISTIEFYPDLSGTLNGVSIREIFLNPENTILVSRKNSNEIEMDGVNSSRIWRAPIITYYRK